MGQYNNEMYWMAGQWWSISNVLFYIVAAVVAFCIGQAAWYYFSTRLGLLSRDSLFQAMSLFINRLIFMVLIIMTLIVWWVFMIVRWEEAGWRKVILFCSARLGLARWNYEKLQGIKLSRTLLQNYDEPKRTEEQHLARADDCNVTRGFHCFDSAFTKVNYLISRILNALHHCDTLIK